MMRVYVNRPITTLQVVLLSFETRKTIILSSRLDKVDFLSLLLKVDLKMSISSAFTVLEVTFRLDRGMAPHSFLTES